MCGSEVSPSPLADEMQRDLDRGSNMEKVQHTQSAPASEIALPNLHPSSMRKVVLKRFVILALLLGVLLYTIATCTPLLVDPTITQASSKRMRRMYRNAYYH